MKHIVRILALAVVPVFLAVVIEPANAAQAAHHKHRHHGRGRHAAAHHHAHRHAARRPQ